MIAAHDCGRLARAVRGPGRAVRSGVAIRSEQPSLDLFLYDGALTACVATARHAEVAPTQLRHVAAKCPSGTKPGRCPPLMKFPEVCALSKMPEKPNETLS